MNKRFHCIQILLIVVCVDTQNFEGDLCLHEKINKDGRCKLFHDCPSAVEDFKKGRPPQTCGFKGNTPIVCCIESVALLMATSQTTTTTRTSTLSTNLESNSYYGPPDGYVGRKSYEKCREFEKYVNVSYVIPGFTTIRYRNVCGFVAAPLIVGGTSAKSKEFPHMAAVGYGEGDLVGFYCGGSLISERFVISAAHCVSHRQFGPAKFVRLGDLNLKSTTDDAAPENFKIIEAIKHPMYNSSQNYNDIALFKLDREVIFNAYIRPICLPVHRNPPTEKAIVTGWGTVDFLHAQSDHLLKATLEFFNFEECSAKIEIHRTLRNGVIDDMQICAGSKQDRNDTCQGDSGGPLQIYHTDPDAYCMYMLVGITSFGKGCGVQSTPGVYTRVQHYIDWIEKTVWP